MSGGLLFDLHPAARILAAEGGPVTLPRPAKKETLSRRLEQLEEISKLVQAA